MAAKIVLLVKDNPKRPKSASFKRFALYRNNMPVADYLAAGGRAADLKWDAAHKFIKVVGK
jgi:hypothetical protein